MQQVCTSVIVVLNQWSQPAELLGMHTDKFGPGPNLLQNGCECSLKKSQHL